MAPLPSEEARSYAAQLDQQLLAHLEGLEGGARRQAEEARLVERLDKSRWKRPDEALFAGILTFYDQALQG